MALNNNYSRNQQLAQTLAQFQPVQGGGLAGALAQGLAGFGTGYYGGKAQQQKELVRTQLADAMAKGDTATAMNILSASGIPEYENIGLKSQMDMAEKAADTKRKAGLLSALTGINIDATPGTVAPGAMTAPQATGGGNNIPDAARLAAASVVMPELAPYASYVAGKEKENNPPAPSGYRKTQTGNLEYIPGGDKDPAVISNLEQSKKAAEKQAELSQAATGALQSVDLIRQQASKISSMKLGPVAGRITGMLDPDVQTLDSLTNQLTLQAKALLGMPSANFSDADRNFLERIVGGSKVSKEALMQNLDNIEILAKKAMSGKQPNMGDAVNPPAGGAPQAGAVEDGYRFKGGNPADPSAWEKVQ